MTCDHLRNVSWITGMASSPELILDSDILRATYMCSFLMLG